MRMISFQPAKWKSLQSVTPGGFDRNLTQKRGLLKVIALLTIWAVAFPPLPSIAVEKAVGKTKTTTKLSWEAGKVKDEVILTATVSPSKATGTVTFYGNAYPKKPHFVALKTISLKDGVAKWSFLDGDVYYKEIKATYNGSTTYATSTSSTIGFCGGPREPGSFALIRC
jgi:hypothetical protein